MRGVGDAVLRGDLERLGAVSADQGDGLRVLGLPKAGRICPSDEVAEADDGVAGALRRGSKGPGSFRGLLAAACSGGRSTLSCWFGLAAACWRWLPAAGAEVPIGRQRRRLQRLTGAAQEAAAAEFASRGWGRIALDSCACDAAHEGAGCSAATEGEQRQR